MQPEKRPENPIPFTWAGLFEIHHHIYTHFIMEKNEQCVNEDGKCVNNLTGCIVGCFLTEKDANENSIESSDSLLDKGILQIYFDVKWAELLKALQVVHDDTTFYDFHAKIYGCLRFLKHVQLFNVELPDS